ncbi:MAG TPA: DUF3048 domain-containing protein [Anaerolineales bacterium]|nr:DUF3048 domain-containing protein [Anaerolineales bacterium]
MKKLLAILFLVCGLSACQNSTTPSAPTVTPAFTATIDSATNPLTVTAQTPAREISTPTAEVPATATSVPMLGPFDFPEGINPLTGLPVTDPEIFSRRPLVVKISNFPRYVRPQSGLQEADMVFEHYAEGGTTRFSAIFWSKAVERIGPIRSARLIDTVIPEMLNASLVTSGTSQGTLNRLSWKNWYDLIIAEQRGFACPPLCRESSDANSMFTKAADLWQALTERELNQAPDTKFGLAFSAQAPEKGALEGKTLQVLYSSQAIDEWRYNTTIGQYERYVEDDTLSLVPHLDQVSQQVITADDVLVLFVNHEVDINVLEDHQEGSPFGHFATEVQLWGVGPALVLRDGKAYELTWVRLETGLFSLVYEGAEHFSLKPGKVWIHTVGLYSDKQANGDVWKITHSSPPDLQNLPPTATPEGFDLTLTADPSLGGIPTLDPALVPTLDPALVPTLDPALVPTVDPALLVTPVVP